MTANVKLNRPALIGCMWSRTTAPHMSHAKYLRGVGLRSCRVNEASDGLLLNLSAGKMLTKMKLICS